MSIFDFRYFLSKTTIVPNRKFLTFFPFDRVLKHDLCFYFNPVNNKEKMKVSGNFAFPTMLQSVACVSFSVFGGSLKIENRKLRSIFVFGRNT